MRRFIDIICESRVAEFVAKQQRLPRGTCQDGLVYHATERANLEAIMRDGVKPTSYWGDEALAFYYGEDLTDPVILILDIRTLNDAHIEPDYPGIHEPITTVLGMNEGQVWEEWDESEQTWEDSMEIVHSLRYTAVIPPSLVRVRRT